MIFLVFCLFLISEYTSKILKRHPLHVYLPNLDKKVRAGYSTDSFSDSENDAHGQHRSHEYECITATQAVNYRFYDGPLQYI